MNSNPDSLKLKCILLGILTQEHLDVLGYVGTCELSFSAARAKFNSYFSAIDTTIERAHERVAIIENGECFIRVKLFRMLLDLSKHLSAEDIKLSKVLDRVDISLTAMAETAPEAQG